MKVEGVKANYDNQEAFVGSERLLEDISISQEMKDQAAKLQKRSQDCRLRWLRPGNYWFNRYPGCT